MRPKDAANLDFWEEWVLLEGYEKRANEAESAPDYLEDEGIPRARSHVGVWTDKSDNAPLHHYPSSTDKMATPEELITLGVQYRQE